MAAKRTRKGQVVPLRRRAEERLRTRGPPPTVPLDVEDSLRRLHELQVHQIELELQNEELVATRGALEASLARYEDLYDFAPVGYLTVDARGFIEEVNHTAAALLGSTRGALAGVEFASCLAPGSREVFRAFLGAFVAGGATRGLEVVLSDEDGTTTLVHLEGRASPGPGSAGLGCRLALVDVSEVRRLEARALQGQKLEAVGLLAAGVAHEINNPLAWLIEGTHFLAEQLASPSPDLEEARQVVRDAVEGLARIREVVRSLRAFSSPQKTVRGPVDPAEELASALRLAGAEIRRRANLVTDLAPLPQVLARPQELSQVFLNLLVNAAQAGPEGAANRHRVTVSSRTDPDGWAVVEVADTGCGMTDDVRARIFEPFFTTKPQGIGTGLGLALVHGIVTAAGGRVEVASAAGTGSTFRVLLPPWSGPDAPPEVRELAAEPLARARLARPRVLVVDGDPRVVRAVASSLREGWAVTTSGSGSEVLTLLERGVRFDAVVCRLSMPGMGGEALQAQVAARWPALGGRFLFLLDESPSAEARDFLARTSSPCLEQPFQRERLLATLTRIGRSP